MPEGHTILRAANHWNSIADQPLTLSSPQGRFSAEAKELNGLPLEKAYAHGKHLFLQFSEEQTIHIHLGLYGRHHWQTAPIAEPKGAVRLRTVFEGGAVGLNGPTKCELIDRASVQKILDRLGPDPLKLEEAPDYFLEKMAKSKKQIGQVLMEQSLIAGVGNVYRAEVLFMAGISPFLMCKDVPTEQFQSLWRLTRQLMLHGVDHSGGIETIYPGAPLPQQVPAEVATACAKRTYVYKRTGLPCVACGESVVQEDYFGRSLYYCPKDQ